MYEYLKKLFSVKEDSYKELAKYAFDISKIVFALALLTPILKDGHFYISAVLIYLLLFLYGIILLKKGEK